MVIRERLDHSTPEAWISDLFVAPDGRRSGLARTLVEACVDEARARGCHRVRLECGVERSDAHAFWTACGFDRRGFDYQKPLG